MSTEANLAAAHDADAPPRVAPLSVLPVFFDLNGKIAVVAGGGAPAAWKAELLAAAGARVRVVAPSLGREMEALAGRRDRAIETVRRRWRAADLAGAAIAVAEPDDADDGLAFWRAARDAGVPCNVIDTPDCCDFQFGTIVNRSPAVIGISTSGAVPVLGQAIRRLVESLLPPDIGRWVAAARSLRARVSRVVGDPPDRRLLWSRFADAALRSRPGTDPRACLEDLLATDGGGGAAGVTLVGAGPGSADHLTFAAVRALQSADVILYDALVSEEVLELARREAERIPVGKRAGRHSCRQDEITARMIALARAGKRVVRLKSGDPMVFGRGTEEIEALEAAGVAVDVVPGITAALALAARLGVSLTDRRSAHSVRLITGHGCGGTLPDLDWRGLADPETTLVFYMGGATAGPLSARLVAAGLSPATPVVVAAGLGTLDERLVRGSLEQLERLALIPSCEAPILMGVGAVFAKRTGSAPVAPGTPTEVRAPGAAIPVEL